MTTWRLILAFADNSTESHEFCWDKPSDLGEQINFGIANRDNYASKVTAIFVFPSTTAQEEVKNIIEAEESQIGIRHGINCQKVRHDTGNGFFHEPNDNGPYYVDNVRYCGRCHSFF